MSKENDNGIFEIAAIAALLFLLWKAFRKVKLTTGEPVTTAPEFMDQFKGDPMNCQNIIYKPLMSSMEPVAATFMGKGWCQKGDGSFFDGKEVAYGDKYADEQAQEWNEQKQTEAIQNINRKYVHFRLINTGATPITTKAFDTTQDSTIFNPAPSAPVATAATGITESQFTANWSAPTGALGFYLDVATDSGFLNYVLGYQNLDVENVTDYIVTGLSDGMTYYYRVRAYNSSGTSINSSTINVTTLLETVDIGTQTWMKSNVKINISGSKVYDNDESNRLIYGGLYSWDMIDEIETAFPGYHVPTNAEWTTLANFLGGSAIAGGKLKETGTTHWNTPNTGADNSTGFTALGGGYCTSLGVFTSIKEQAYFWQNTELNPTTAQHSNLFYDSDDLNEYGGTSSKTNFLSVRLIKD